MNMNDVLQYAAYVLVAIGVMAFLYDRKFLHSEETILKMPAFMRAPKQDDY